MHKTFKPMTKKKKSYIYKYIKNIKIKKYINIITETSANNDNNKANKYLISRKPEFELKQSKVLNEGFCSIRKSFEIFKIFTK